MKKIICFLVFAFAGFTLNTSAQNISLDSNNGESSTYSISVDDLKSYSSSILDESIEKSSFLKKYIVQELKKKATIQGISRTGIDKNAVLIVVGNSTSSDQLKATITEVLEEVNNTLVTAIQKESPGSLKDYIANRLLD